MRDTRKAAGPILTDRQTMRLDQARETRMRDRVLIDAASKEHADRRWYVAIVREGHEIVVNNVLADSGVEGWLPVIEMHKRRMRSSVFVPVLPGYLFVNVQSSAATWAGLSTIEGMRGPIGGADKPSPLKANEIASLRAFLDAGDEARKVVTNAIEAGMQVEISDGPFRGFTAIVNLISSHRVSVAVNVFGRETPIDLELAQVKKSV